MKEITKLEERLEWNRKQQSKLGHEYGELSLIFQKH
jgi:hypothetical protein